MKTSSILRLATKNLYHNFSRSILTLIAITLLSIAIITLCNMSFYYDKNLKAISLENLQQNGTEVSIQAKKEGDFLQKADIEKFMAETEKINVFYEYEIEEEAVFGRINVIEEDYIPLKAYLVEKQRYEGNPTIAQGQIWRKEDKEKNHIWLSESIAETKGIQCGETITIGIGEENIQFVVKGTVESNENFIDKNFLKIKKLTVYDRVNKYHDLSIVKKINEIRKIENQQVEIYGMTIGMNIEHRLMAGFVAGISIFLTVLCILLSMGSILNTMKISIMKNSQSIGILKALGMRNKNIYQYILFQVGILIIIATFISTLTSWIIAKFTLAQQLETVMQVVGEYDNVNIIVGYNFLLPLLNIAILAIAVVLGSIKMLTKYFNKEAIVIMQEVE